MRQTVILVSFLLLGYSLRAQQGYFITIDADENQTFSVSVGKKFYSSSSIGHLVVPNLKDSVYKLSFNFPGTEYKQQVFTVKMDRRDKGLRLKKNNEKGWSLLDGQTRELIRADGESGSDEKTQPIVGKAQPTDANKSVSGELPDPRKRVSTAVDEEKKLPAEEIKPPVQEKPSANMQKGSADQDTPATAKTNNAFARLMASVVNDTAVMYNTTLRAPKKKVDTAAKKVVAKDKDTDTVTVVKKKQPDSTSVAAKQKTDNGAGVAPAAAKKADSDGARAGAGVAAIPNAAGDSMHKQPRAQLPDSSVVKIERQANAGIRLIHERRLSDAREYLYVETGPDGGKDTIDISIALEPKKAVDSSKAANGAGDKVDSIAKKADTGQVQKNAPDSGNVKTGVNTPKIREDQAGRKLAAGAGVAATVANVESDSEVKAKKDTTNLADSVARKGGETMGGDSASAKKKEEKKVALINSDCKAFAADSDVDKLRVKLLAENNLDERVMAAKKIFRTKCFTTKQIRALSELFTSDNARYTFFDAAYPFVSDTENFKTLIDLFTDEYYIGRFKAMVRL